MALTIASSLRLSAEALHQSEGLIWLIELRRTATVTAYYTLWPESVIYGGQTYTPVVGEIQDWSQEQGSLVELKLVMSNVDRTLQGYVESGEIVNRRATIRVLSTLSIAPFGSGAAGQDLSMNRYVESAACNSTGIEFTLSLWQLQAVEVPRQQFMRDKCMWVFKDARTCGYSGAATTCDKTYNSSSGCLGRSNQARYGAFINLFRGPTVVLP